MKKVIFIAGTAYSGSSMLDMILGSSEFSFSMGEVRALFYPTKKHHINPPCGCGNNACTIWQTIKKMGERNLYPNIFDSIPETKTIIDSSKEPFWIAKQRKRLEELGIESRIILIWKSPEEFALSCLKRGNFESWNNAWVNYHRQFFSLSRSEYWRSLRYKELAVFPEKTINKLCDTVDVKYNPNMLDFWEKKHHMLFGNTLAKYHMYEKSNEKFSKSLKNLSNREINFDNEKNELERRHRSIYYVTDYINQLPPSVYSILKKNQFIGGITALLMSRDININSETDIVNLKNKRLFYPKIILDILKAKRFFKYKFFKKIGGVGEV